MSVHSTSHTNHRKCDGPSPDLGPEEALAYLRSDSTLTSTDNAWYIPHLQKQLYIAGLLLDEQGNLPSHVQQALLDDLNQRIRQQVIPENLLRHEEEQAYKETLFRCFDNIDNQIFKNQRALWAEQRLWAVTKKHDSRMIVVDETGERRLKFDGLNVYFYSHCQLAIEFVDLGPDTLTVEGYAVASPLGYSSYALCARVGDNLIECKAAYRKEPHRALGETIMEYHGFRLEVPLAGREDLRVDFLARLDGHPVEFRNVTYKKYSPVSREVPGSYYLKDGWMLTPEGNGLRVRRAGRRAAVAAELRFARGLWEKNGLGMRKALVLRGLAHLARLLRRRRVWLISDKANRADDNGEALFAYLREHAEPGVRPVFLIGRDSPDYGRLRKVGEVAPYMSWRHKLLYLSADFSVSAYSHDEINNPFLGEFEAYRDMLQACRYIFLQHGVTKDNISRGANRWHKNMAGFVTSARREYDSVVGTPAYGYSASQVWLTGLPRYDRLYHDERDEIVVMPTWRRELFGDYHAEGSVWDLKPGFQQSDYLVFYKTLLSHPRLLSEAARLGYAVNFVPHPVFFPYVDQFEVPDQVRLWGSEVCYRDMFARSRLLLTDYSSVAFDFAYLRKPVLYAHFDTNHYAEGYFDYERDGFGEVCRDVEETVDRIVAYMREGCPLKEEYRERIDGFFEFGDKENSKRVYEKIRELQNKRLCPKKTTFRLSHRHW